MAVSVFLDTSVLLAGLIDFGPQSAPAQIADARDRREALAGPPRRGTAASSSSRWPPGFRRSSGWRRLMRLPLLTTKCFARMSVHDLPAAERDALLATAAQDATVGGRIYDAHIAEVARAAGAGVIVTDNRRHFLSALRHGMRVETPSEYPRLEARAGKAGRAGRAGGLSCQPCLPCPPGLHCSTASAAATA